MDAPPEAILRRAEALAHVYRVTLAPGTSVGEAARAYAADPHVAWAQVDSPRVLDDLAPDPFLLSAGSWGQPYEDLWGHHRIRAQEAWAESTGEGVVVAVVDSGLDWRHPDIADNVFVHPGEDLNGNGRVDEDEWNGVDDDGNGFVDDLLGFDFVNSIDANGDGDYVDPGDSSDADPFDDNGHGTHVAGIVAAVAGNGEGIAGVAPGARIMSLKGFSAEGRGSDAVLWRAVLYAVMNGAQVVNNSWSCSTPCPRNPLGEEVVELAHALGTTIVTSAGNRSRDVNAFSPENMWQTITVGSSDVDDGPSLSFTNQGLGVDVLAPGGDPQETPGPFVPRRNILSLRSSGGDPVEAPFEVGDGQYIRLAGTSMSAPQVAGVAALLYAQRPGITPDEIRRIVRRSAVDLGRPGHDWATGAGRLDAAAAVTAPEEPEWLLRVTAPRASDWFDPRDGDIEIRGTAAGPDLRRYSVSIGAGVDPTVWTLLEESDVPVDQGVLATWALPPDAVGAWVIRVEAEAIDGRTAIEHVPVSFERLPLEVLSSEGPAAELPAVHGRRVVWQSRRGETEDAFGRPDYDLFEARFGGRGDRPLLVAPGDQTQPDLSVDRRIQTLTWLSRPEPAAPRRGQACRRALLGGGTCEPVDIGDAADQTKPLVPIRDFVYWTQSPDGTSSVTEISACRLMPDAETCSPIDTGLEPGARAFLVGDGRGTLAWTAIDDGLRSATCEVGDSGDCAEQRLAPASRAFDGPVASRRLLAWVGVRFTGPRPLLACRIDEAGECEPVQIVDDAVDERVRVSGDLVVWDGAVGDEPGDVFFCELDPLRGTCPVQRLTSEGSLQGDSDVDGRRVVWVDERFGAGRVVGVELPSWRPVGPRRVHAGRRLDVTSWLLPAGRVAAEIEVVATRADAGEGSSSLPPSLERLAPRRGIVPVAVSWCPTDADVGRHVWTLRARADDGLWTRTSFVVDVLPATADEGTGPPDGRSSIAHGLPVDACATESPAAAQAR